MVFEWDPKKAAINFEKHGVTFEEASTAFEDSTAAIFDDTKHSLHEKRKLFVGNSRAGRMLLVAFTEREPAIRIISARKANAGERKRHEAYQKIREATSDRNGRSRAEL